MPLGSQLVGEVVQVALRRHVGPANRREVLHQGCGLLMPEHARTLLLGTAESSPLFFRWIRAYVDALGVPADTVGPLITLYWAGRLVWHHGVAAEFGPPTWLHDMANAWFTAPGLGPDWNRWQ